MLTYHPSVLWANLILVRFKLLQSSHFLLWFGTYELASLVQEVDIRDAGSTGSLLFMSFHPGQSGVARFALSASQPAFSHQHPPSSFYSPTLRELRSSTDTDLYVYVHSIQRHKAHSFIYRNVGLQEEAARLGRRQHAPGKKKQGPLCTRVDETPYCNGSSEWFFD